MANIVKLLDAVTANTTGSPIKIRRDQIKKYGSIPILIESPVAMTANVNIEATIATDQEVDEGSAEFHAIGAAWTTEGIQTLSNPWTHIRGVVDTYVAGTITLKVVL